MKVYQAFYQSASDATCCYWGRTKTEARGRAASAAYDDDIENRDAPLRSYQVVEHKIKPRAEGLCEWLNEVFTRDNG